MHFSGVLQPQGDSDGALKTSLSIAGSRVEIFAGGETLGSWPVSQVRAERMDGNRFELELGEDRAVFLADDALAFSYEALPRLAKNPLLEAAHGLRFKFRGGKAKGGSGPSATEVEEDLASDSEFELSNTWTDEPVEEPPANVKRLRDLIEAARANRTEGAEESAAKEGPEPQVATLALEPPLQLLPPVPDLEPEPIWAEGGLARPLLTEEPSPSPDLTPRFSTRAATSQSELLDELEQLMRAVQSGVVSDSQVPAITNLIKSLRSLIE